MEENRAHTGLWWVLPPRLQALWTRDVLGVNSRWLTRLEQEWFLNSNTGFCNSFLLKPVSRAATVLLFFEYVFVSYKVPMGLTGKQIFKSSLCCLTFIFLSYIFILLYLKLFLIPKHMGLFAFHGV